MKVLISNLEDLNRKALLKAGYSDSECAIILDVLFYGYLRGNHQGLIQFITSGYTKDPEAEPLEVLKETPFSSWIDGKASNGILVMHEAMELCLQKVKQNGAALVGTCQAYEGTGAIGYYVSKIASQGYLALACSGSKKRVAFYGGTRPVLGTNPIAFGLPTKSDPIVFDMATSSTAFFKVVESYLLGRDLTEDLAFDKEGRTTKDSKKAIEGALKSFGPKGSGLGLVIEALTGPLVGSSDQENNRGNLIAALDPDLFSGKDHFFHSMEKLKNTIKSSSSKITLPGERSELKAEKSRQDGFLELDDTLYDSFCKKINDLQ